MLRIRTLARKNSPRNIPDFYRIPPEIAKPSKITGPEELSIIILVIVLFPIKYVQVQSSVLRGHSTYNELLSCFVVVV